MGFYIRTEHKDSGKGRNEIGTQVKGREKLGGGESPPVILRNQLIDTQIPIYLSATVHGIIFLHFKQLIMIIGVTTGNKISAEGMHSYA